MPDDVTSNRHGGNKESTAARNSLSAARIEGDCQKIVCLAARRQKTGITCDEAEVILGMSHQTCSARFTELVRDKRIVRTDERRKTRSGRAARVHVV